VVWADTNNYRRIILLLFCSVEEDCMNRVLMCVLLAGTMHSAFAQDSPASCTAAQGALVGAFRVMNTAELRYYEANNRYANRTELLSFAETRKLSSNISYSTPSKDSVALGTADDPLNGYVLRIVVASDGKSYSISATKKDAPCKWVGATTDERGLIFLMEPLR
jgi:hypothetical protein